MNRVPVNGTAVDMERWVWVAVLLQAARILCNAVSENKKPKEYLQLSMLLHAHGPQKFVHVMVAAVTCIMHPHD